MVIYNLICEKTDEPCAAEVRSFGNLDKAKEELERILNGSWSCYAIDKENFEKAKKDLKNNKNLAFTLVINPSDMINLECHIEVTTVE